MCVCVCVCVCLTVLLSADHRFLRIQNEIAKSEGSGTFERSHSETISRTIANSSDPLCVSLVERGGVSRSTSFCPSADSRAISLSLSLSLALTLSLSSLLLGGRRVCVRWV